VTSFHWLRNVAQPPIRKNWTKTQAQMLEVECRAGGQSEPMVSFGGGGGGGGALASPGGILVLLVVVALVAAVFWLFNR
jgi:hypothetical protein